MFKKIGLAILSLLIGAIIYAIWWGITVGLLWLIFHCFGLEFTLLKATGIWLVIVLLYGIIKK